MTGDISLLVVSDFVQTESVTDSQIKRCGYTVLEPLRGKLGHWL
jgi:hypothetical protein